MTPKLPCPRPSRVVLEGRQRARIRLEDGREAEGAALIRINNGGRYAH